MMAKVKLDDNQIILSNTFKYFVSNSPVTVNLYSNKIDFYDLKSYDHSSQDITQRLPTRSLPLKDLAGSLIGKSGKKNDKNAYLTLYAYPATRKHNELVKRKRLTIELASNKFDTHEENLSYMNQWQKNIEALVKKKELDSDQNEKPYLIFVNPKAGAGKAKNIYYERIVPVWAEANISNILFLTEYSNHARDHVKKIRVTDYRGIIVVSGDGLVYEIINGLMDREDWREAIKVPICQIPGGSANALACCVSNEEKQPFKHISLEHFATCMSFNLIRATPKPMDLTRFQLADKSIVHSFLCLEWAIIADVDLESEKYRFLGGLRFAVGAIKRILNLRIYRGRISFLPTDDMKDYKPKNSSIKIHSNTNNEPREQIEQFQYLNPIDKPVPKDWLTIEENFILFLVVNVPLIAPDFLASPDSKFNDGHMLMIFIKEGAKKTELLQMFSETETGKHLDSPLVEFVKIKAFRLEPQPYMQQSDGVLMVDGERVPYGNIQGEIMPSCANILANY